MSYPSKVTTSKENPVQVWRKAQGVSCLFPAYASLSPPGQSEDSWTWLWGCWECSPSMLDYLELHVLPPFEMPKIPVWQQGAPPPGAAPGASAPPLKVPEIQKAYASYETYHEMGHRRKAFCNILLVYLSSALSPLPTAG